MVLFNYSTRELTAKVVYYGPGICGKTTNLQYIYENLPGDVRGKMLSLATKTDRTLFFDFLPIDLGEIRGMKTRVQLYTVPGQVFYNETRKLVLKGVDGIVFVADSQATMAGANVESFRNLEENLKGHGLRLADLPHVIQFNKRDLPKLSSIEEMNSTLNKYNAPFYESVATTGIGVQDTLKAIVKLVLLNLTRKYETKTVPESTSAMAAVGSVSTPVPARASAPVAIADETTPAPAQVKRAGAPAKATEPPAPPRRPSAPGAVVGGSLTPPPIQAMPPFDENEIDGLVDEVEDLEVPQPPAPADESVWMGEAETPETPAYADDASAYGSSVPVEDYLKAMPSDDAKKDEFEVDRGFDPEWAAPIASPRYAEPEEVAASADDMAPIAPFPIPVEGDEDTAVDEVEEEPELLLTEIASDDDLFTDPTLEIAHLTDGQAREIIVPVMLGEGPSAKRYKLAIRLRLQPID